MGCELIISEKPNAAKKIAEALADGKAIKENDNGIPFYKLTHGKQDIIVGCAVGHLYGLKETKKEFPVFDIEWVPSAEVNKSSAFSKKYLSLLQKLAKQCNTFTVATDFDIEGEVIGLNIIRYIAKKKDANRMKFSTLTKDELRNSYAKKSKHLEWGQAHAGETRHKLDWYYGINISRALTDAIKKGGMFKLLSTGRVQGPALKLLVQREKEIQAFTPTPYWEIELTGNLEKGKIKTSHKEGKFEDEKKVLKILEKTKGHDANIKDMKTKEFKQNPPVPFDLTSLQIEAHTRLKITPKETLALAQELYTGGFISYPRTSSQKYPKEIGYKKILKALGKQKSLKKYADEILAKKNIKPNEGKKEDPAHPAIYPTGIEPKGIKEREKKLYDLIARRFLAVFGEAAVKETVTYTVDCNKEEFIAKGTITKELNWLEYYPYAQQKEEELPETSIGEKVKRKKITKLDKETQPPKRYTEASIIKELEKRSLGTKATRATIVDTLFKRDYLDGKKIEVTDLGLKVEQILEKYFPKITDEAMTRGFEEDMEKIREGKETPDEVLKKARKVITHVIKDLEKKELQVGEALKETFQETKEKAETFGECPKCHKGMLKLRKGKFGRFIACDQYPDCKTTFSIPHTGMVKPTDEVCDTCKSVKVEVINKGKRPQHVCLNPECPTKQVDKVEGEGETCDKCKKGKMIIRRSLYGTFLGCDQYPKCKNLKQIPKNEKEMQEKAVKMLKEMK